MCHEKEEQRMGHPEEGRNDSTGTGAPAQIPKKKEPPPFKLLLEG